MRRFSTFLLPFAALLLWPAAISARTLPSVSNTAKPDAVLRWRTIILRHTAPQDILKLMRWENGGGEDDTQAINPSPPFGDMQGEVQSDHPHHAHLPVGIVCIFALRSNNSLLLQATDAGFEQVKQIVNALDISSVPAHQVQLAVLVAAIPQDFELGVNLLNPQAELSAIKRVSTVKYDPLVVTTQANTTIPISVKVNTPRVQEPTSSVLTMPLPPSSLLRTRLVDVNSYLQMPPFYFKSQINSHQMVTLQLTVARPHGAVSNQKAHDLHNLFSGELTVFDITNDLQPNGYRILLFVTPTIFGTDNGNITITP